MGSGIKLWRPEPQTGHMAQVLALTPDPRLSSWVPLAVSVQDSLSHLDNQLCAGQRLSEGNRGLAHSSATAFWVTEKEKSYKQGQRRDCHQPDRALCSESWWSLLPFTADIYPPKKTKQAVLTSPWLQLDCFLLDQEAHGLWEKSGPLFLSNSIYQFTVEK